MAFVTIDAFNGIYAKGAKTDVPELAKNIGIAAVAALGIVLPLVLMTAGASADPAAGMFTECFGAMCQ